MDEQLITIVLCTRNRARLLEPALRCLLDQRAPGAPYEIVVVDNDSTDETAAVVKDVAARAPLPVRYVFEAGPDLSRARNAGLRAANGTIVAFTDDDVRIGPDWVAAIAGGFAAHTSVDCLGGRTLPLWPSEPPRWLTRRHWVGPLALQDYGDIPVIIDARRPLCLAGANCAFRRGVFERIGLYSPAFPRSEDTELLLRLWRSGARALYVPGMIAHAAVQPERLRKAYHRRWHTNIGRCNARMRFEELSDPRMGLRPGIPEPARLLGVPVFALRQLAAALWRWAIDSVRRREAEAFLHELRARALVAYMGESRRLYRRGILPKGPARDVPANAGGY